MGKKKLAILDRYWQIIGTSRQPLLIHQGQARYSYKMALFRSARNDKSALKQYFEA